LNRVRVVASKFRNAAELREELSTEAEGVSIEAAPIEARAAEAASSKALSAATHGRRCLDLAIHPLRRGCREPPAENFRRAENEFRRRVDGGLPLFPIYRKWLDHRRLVGGKAARTRLHR
jgi:hypothetical protein